MRVTVCVCVCVCVMVCLSKYITDVCIITNLCQLVVYMVLYASHSVPPPPLQTFLLSVAFLLGIYMCIGYFNLSCLQRFYVYIGLSYLQRFGESTAYMCMCTLPLTILKHSQTGLEARSIMYWHVTANSRHSLSGWW